MGTYSLAFLLPHTSKPLAASPQQRFLYGITFNSYVCIAASSWIACDGIGLKSCYERELYDKHDNLENKFEFSQK